ncbi:MAG TPA: ATP-binding cassette domain-containing protein [Longimicrobium sp.]|nr:ATP-binding cassette domain-containing protein [Longimicrobium sp.]
MLAAEGVVKRYGGVMALEGVSIQAAAGECIALVGESGSGKTTLLRCFNRMTEPDGGRVTVEAADAASADAVELRRRIGYVQQEGGLLPHWTVLRNASLVPWLRGEADAEAKGAAALEWVGLDPAEFGRRWPRARASCCWTSRSARWTRSPARSCGRRSARCGASWRSRPCW